jgi:hypothetical protein
MLKVDIQLPGLSGPENASTCACAGCSEANRSIGKSAQLKGRNIHSFEIRDLLCLPWLRREVQPTSVMQTIVGHCLR